MTPFLDFLIILTVVLVLGMIFGYKLAEEIERETR